MKLIDLVKQIRESEPEALGSLSNSAVATVLRAGLGAVRIAIDEAGNEVVSVPLLGRFKSRDVETEQNGEKRTTRRTVFLPAKERQAAGA
jgi:hypothetical protein